VKAEEIKFLSDKGLRQIDAKEFRRQVGITKTDYRLLRNLTLAGWNLEDMSIWVPDGNDDKKLTLHEFCQKLRGIDVIYITRLQKERHT